MGAIKRILVGYNGTAESMAAVRLAAGLANPLQSSVIIVFSSVGGPKEDPDDIEEAQRQLNEAQQLVTREGIFCEVHQTARGLAPGEDLVKYANENDVDLIVVGVEKKSRIEKIVIGSTAQHVILKAPCPVLTVK